MSTRIRLQWDKNTELDMQDYDIFRSGTPGVTTSSTLISTIPQPAEGTTVTYDDDTATDNAAPNAPGWQATPVASGGNSANVQFTKPSDNGTPWYFRVRARDTEGNVSALSGEATDTVLSGIPEGAGSGAFEIYRGAAEGFTPDTAAYTNRVSIVDCSTGLADGAAISYSDAGAVDTTAPNAVGSPSIAAGSDSGTTGPASNWVRFTWVEPTDNGTSYYYKLRAKDNIGNWSSFSTEESVSVASGIRTLEAYHIIEGDDMQAIAALADKGTTSVDVQAIDTTPPPTTAISFAATPSADAPGSGTGHVDLTWSNPLDGGFTASPNYKIVAFDEAGNTALSTQLNSVNVDAGYYGCRILWKEGTSYPASYDDASASSYDITNSATTSHTLSGLTSQATYSVSIFFRDRADNWSLADAAQCQAQVTIPDTTAPAAPTNLTATAI